MFPVNLFFFWNWYCHLPRVQIHRHVYHLTYIQVILIEPGHNPSPFWWCRRYMGHKKMLGLLSFFVSIFLNLGMFEIFSMFQTFSMFFEKSWQKCPNFFLSVFKNLCSKKHKYFLKHLEKSLDLVIFVLIFFELSFGHRKNLEHSQIQKKSKANMTKSKLAT